MLLIKFTVNTGVGQLAIYVAICVLSWEFSSLQGVVKGRGVDFQ